MQITQYLRVAWKRRDVLVIFFLLCCVIGYLSWQFGLAQLGNQQAPNSAEQYKIYYPYVAGLLNLIVPFLISGYIDEQVKQESKEARNAIRSEETSEGIRAKQELEFVASCADNNSLLSVDSFINIDVLSTVVQKKIQASDAKSYLDTISEDEKQRDETVKALLKQNNKKDDFALILARSATFEEFGRSQADTHNTICKELYICLKAWLVCSLKKGRYMPVEALKLTYPQKKYMYKAALRRIYEDIIHRDTSKAYLPIDPIEADSTKRVITKYLEWLITHL